MKLPYLLIRTLSVDRAMKRLAWSAQIRIKCWKIRIIEVTLLITSFAHKRSLSLWCVVLITFAISHYQEQKLDRHWFILCALRENRAEKSDVFLIYGFTYSNSYWLSEPWVMVLFSSCKALCNGRDKCFR